MLPEHFGQKIHAPADRADTAEPKEKTVPKGGDRRSRLRVEPPLQFPHEPSYKAHRVKPMLRIAEQEV